MQVRIAAYCLMPNHWHLVVAPPRWRTLRGAALDHGHPYATLACASQDLWDRPVYQGRFKSFPVQTDEHFLTVASPGIQIQDRVGTKVKSVAQTRSLAATAKCWFKRFGIGARSGW
ncbi:hypothetical protein NITMOv2_2328 [Nitrospira moscoviensis]|uniref:Transposase IS200-like domain-containing protein n=1 Tax=Nitrospira moscoviensis TaxID=42253 RepID=A0A0K2GCR7_NITMO|nr:hypothetical protein NITMOv2_2328 [Nitrospira moscoviensis]